MTGPRIALIHALRHSPPPIEAAFAASWPEARLMNLLDDSLSADLARDGTLTPAMTQRFVQLGRYAVATGADAILFTCSAFGPCIEAVARDQKIPVLKPNEAMIEEAVAIGGTVGLMATFAPTLASMPAEFPSNARIRTCLVEGALAALDRGDTATHDQLAGRAADAVKDCDVIALAQFSLARSAPRIAEATGKPVLTTPDSAVRRLRLLLR
jgi:Asp/Glu/hydantoin racemase